MVALLGARVQLPAALVQAWEGLVSRFALPLRLQALRLQPLGGTGHPQGMVAMVVVMMTTTGRFHSLVAAAELVIFPARLALASWMIRMIGTEGRHSLSMSMSMSMPGAIRRLKAPPPPQVQRPGPPVDVWPLTMSKMTALVLDLLTQLSPLVVVAQLRSLSDLRVRWLPTTRPRLRLSVAISRK